MEGPGKAAFNPFCRFCYIDIINHKSIKMKKSHCYFPLIGLSQYVDMWHFSVPSDETNIYEATEKDGSLK